MRASAHRHSRPLVCRALYGKLKGGVEVRPSLAAWLGGGRGRGHVERNAMAECETRARVVHASGVRGCGGGRASKVTLEPGLAGAQRCRLRGRPPSSRTGRPDSLAR